MFHSPKKRTQKYLWAPDSFCHMMLTFWTVNLEKSRFQTILWRGDALRGQADMHYFPSLAKALHTVFALRVHYICHLVHSAMFLISSIIY